jgi:hypothetical protein
MAPTTERQNQASILSYTKWFSFPHSQPPYVLLIALPPLSHSSAPFASPPQVANTLHDHGRLKRPQRSLVPN